jgi:hypothetical protein
MIRVRCIISTKVEVSLLKDRAAGEACKLRRLKSDALCCFLAVVGEPLVRQKLKFPNNSIENLGEAGYI